MNRIEEILKCLDGEQKYGEPPRETEGFESLISEEEFEAIMKVAEAMENYVNVHNKCVADNIDKFMDAPSYAHIQLLLFGDVVNDASKAIGMMQGVHTCNKELIDNLAESEGFTVEGLERHLEKMMLEKRFTQIFG